MGGTREQEDRNGMDNVHEHRFEEVTKISAASLHFADCADGSWGRPCESRTSLGKIRGRDKSKKHFSLYGKMPFLRSKEN